MTGLSHKAILWTYLLLFLVTGGLTLFFGGHSTLPPPTLRPQVEELKTTLSDPKLERVYGDEIAVTRERLRRLSEMSTGAFTTVLGALIGFLSGAWSGRPGPSPRPPGQGVAEASNVHS
jgi:hypothetical protein